MIQLKPNLSTLLLCFIFSTCFALESDKGELLHVTSDSLTINHKTGDAHYLGNATAIQGSSRLTGAEIITHTGKNGRIDKIIALGDKNKQASYQTLPMPKQRVFSAHADTITFYANMQVAILEGNATGSQGKNHFEGPNLIYNLKEQEIRNKPGRNAQSTVVFEQD
jgi:lipopolysaccharide transport protein LptA